MEGYKSIRAAEIHLGPINVLIGANGSGKSNLVGVFGLLADLADHRLQLHVARQGGADALLHFGAKKSPAMGFSLRFGLHGYEASLIHAVGDTLMFEYEVTLQWVARKANQDPLSGDPIPMYLGRSGHKETELRFNPMDSRQDLIGATGPVVVKMKRWRPFHFHDTGKSAPTKQKQKQKIDDNRKYQKLWHGLIAISAIGVDRIRAVCPHFHHWLARLEALAGVG